MSWNRPWGCLSICSSASKSVYSEARIGDCGGPLLVPQSHFQSEPNKDLVSGVSGFDLKLSIVQFAHNLGV